MNSVEELGEIVNTNLFRKPFCKNCRRFADIFEELVNENYSDELKEILRISAEEVNPTFTSDDEDCWADRLLKER